LDFKKIQQLKHNNKRNINLNLKQNFAYFTENNLFNEKGKEIESYGKIQQKAGKTKDEVKKMIAELQSTSKKNKLSTFY
jgi:uncharacterized protein YjbJ (UPF0337 family)